MVVYSLLVPLHVPKPYTIIIYLIVSEPYSPIQDTEVKDVIDEGFTLRVIKWSTEYLNYIISMVIVLRKYYRSFSPYLCKKFLNYGKLRKIIKTLQEKERE